VPHAFPGVTGSLCPVCLRRLDAERIDVDGVVHLSRTCPEHGDFSVPVWRGSPSMASWRRPKSPSPPNPEGVSGQGCPLDCGLCSRHSQHTCTALVEVTGRCDLGCPVCFASSGATGPAGPSLAELSRRFVALRAKAGSCNLQLSGGEPTTRPDLPDIVRAARAAGFGFVQLNSNGLRLGGETGYAESLAEAGLDSVFLQFDGSDAACRALRGRPLLARKLRALEACAGAGLGVVLVPTLAAGVNDGECGDIVRLALSSGPAVRGVHFQPMAAFGRHPGGNGPAPGGMRGPTLPEVLTSLVDQCGGLVSATDFHPPCCEHELCSFSGTFLRRKDGTLAPLAQASGCCEPGPAPKSPGGIPTALEGAEKSRAFTALQWSGPGQERPLPDMADDFDRFLAEAGTRNRLTISCMAFQDAWSVDLERTRGCCIHVSAPDGSLVPFCLYNLTSVEGRPLHRGRHGEDAS